MVENQAHQYLDNFKAQISRQFPYEEDKKMTGMDDAKLLEEAKEPAPVSYTHLLSTVACSTPSRRCTTTRIGLPARRKRKKFRKNSKLILAI